MPGLSVLKRSILEGNIELAETQLRKVDTALRNYIKTAENSRSRGNMARTLSTLERAKIHYATQNEKIKQLFDSQSAPATINYTTLTTLQSSVDTSYAKIMVMEKQTLDAQIERATKIARPSSVPLPLAPVTTTTTILPQTREALLRRHDTLIQKTQEKLPVDDKTPASPHPDAPNKEITDPTKPLPANDRYLQELDKLRIARDRQSTQLKDRINPLIAQIEKQKSKTLTSNELEDLILILINTTKRLSNRAYTHQEYEAFAKQTQGKSSTAMKVIGSLMIALALTALIVVGGIVCCPALAAIAGTVASTAAVSTTVQGIVGGAAASVLGMGGAYTFFSGCRKGISAEMGGVAKEVAHTAPAYT